MFSPHQKLRILEEVLINKRPIASVCREFKISRFSFYKWVLRLRSANAELRSGSLSAPLHLKKKQILKLFEDKRPRGKKHFRSVDRKREKLILDCVLKNPAWSSQQISEYLKTYKKGKHYVSNHGVWNVLAKAGLNTSGARYEYISKHPVKSVFPNRLSDFEKYKILSEAQKGEASVKEICRRFHISRFTYYAWLNKYSHERTVASLASARPRAEAHHRYVGDKIREPILTVVAFDPSLSAHAVSFQKKVKLFSLMILKN